MNPFAGGLWRESRIDESSHERALFRGNDLVILTAEWSNGIVLGMEREVGDVVGM
jgi:hypothetical protein